MSQHSYIGIIKNKVFDLCVWHLSIVSKGSNKLANAQNEDETVGENDDIARVNGFVKLTKAEKRAKLKKLRKEAKKQGTPVV